MDTNSYVMFFILLFQKIILNWYLIQHLELWVAILCFSPASSEKSFVTNTRCNSWSCVYQF